MPDNKFQGETASDGHHLPDHDHITVDQTHEVEALMAKFKKTQAQVVKAITKAGPSRVQIERALRKYKRDAVVLQCRDLAKAEPILPNYPLTPRLISQRVPSSSRP